MFERDRSTALPFEVTTPKRNHIRSTLWAKYQISPLWEMWIYSRVTNIQYTSLQIVAIIYVMKYDPRQLSTDEQALRRRLSGQ